MAETTQSWSEIARPQSDTGATARTVHGGFGVTSILFAIYLIAHFAYLLNIGQVSWFSAIYPIAAVGLMVRPRTPWLFALGAAASLADILMHLPMQSNHALMSAAFCAGVSYTFMRQALAARRLVIDADSFFAEFAPLGRWLLIGMYFYGVFHKLNTDFLSPDVSCAVVLWRAFDFPFSISDWPVAHAAAIYGTLVVETFAILCLLSSRFRYHGLLAGISFHWLIGFNPYQDYVAFSLISILLHSLFFPPVEERISNHRTSALLGIARRPVPHACIILAVLILPLVLGRDAAWFLFGLVLLPLVVVFARDTGRASSLADYLRPKSLATGLLAAAFLANGMLPYLGLKTGQTISMFSNLTTEGGESNHLLMAHVPQVFGYQRRLAEVVRSDDPIYDVWKDGDYRLVEWSVLDRFERTGLATTFRVGGEEIALRPEDRARVAADLPGRLLRSVFIFKPVNMTRPRTCDSY